MGLFKNKTPKKISKYVRTICGLDKVLSNNKKLKKLLFENDMEKYYHFLRDNLQYLL